MALATRPKRSAHHKKRAGKHHRHSKVYMKPYWPYLPMLLIVGFGLWMNALWSNHSVLGGQSDFTNQALLQATNAERTSDHLDSLTLDNRLTAAAQAKAEDMASHDYWSHNAPDGRTPWSFITASGYAYQIAGENLAYGFNDAHGVVIGWMNSPEHRANVLGSGYQNVGFGVASSPDYQGHGPETIVVAEYAAPSQAAANISFTVNNPPAQVKSSTDIAARPVARIQEITGGQAAWSLVAVSVLTGIGLTLFVIHHGFRVKRLLNQGEAFVAHHPYFDIAVTVLLVAGYMLTRTSGLIR